MRALPVGIVCLFALLVTGCAWGDSGPEFCQGVDCSGHGTCVYQDGAEACQCEAGYRVEGLECLLGELGQASSLTADIDNGLAYVSLRTMTVDRDGLDWDFRFFEVQDGPVIWLAENVTVATRSSSIDFHEVDEAPLDGYLPDTDQDPAIGDSFRSGGTCHEGFTMSGIIYILHLADGTFAKLEILSGREGVFDMLSYRQPDGSRNLATEP